MNVKKLCKKVWWKLHHNTEMVSILQSVHLWAKYSSRVILKKGKKLLQLQHQKCQQTKEKMVTIFVSILLVLVLFLDSFLSASFLSSEEKSSFFLVGEVSFGHFDSAKEVTIFHSQKQFILPWVHERPRDLSAGNKKKREESRGFQGIRGGNRTKGWEGRIGVRFWNMHRYAQVFWRSEAVFGGNIGIFLRRLPLSGKASIHAKNVPHYSNILTMIFLFGVCGIRLTISQ